TSRTEKRLDGKQPIANTPSGCVVNVPSPPYVFEPREPLDKARGSDKRPTSQCAHDEDGDIREQRFPFPPPEEIEREQAKERFQHGEDGRQDGRFNCPAPTISAPGSGERSHQEKRHLSECERKEGSGWRE